MAILKNTVQVNNGNAGWSSTHVLDALEETFYQLGWNSGAQVNGVVTTCFPPGSSDPWQTDKWTDDWYKAGGHIANIEPIRQVDYFVTDDSVNETFTFRRAWYINSGNDTQNYATINGHGFSPGDELLYYHSIDNKNGATQYDLFTGATQGQSVFVAPDATDASQAANRVKFYATELDALDGINEIDINYVVFGHYLTRTTTQTTIDDINMEDTIKFHSYNAALTTQMNFQDQAGAYNFDREISTNNYRSGFSYVTFPIMEDMTSADNTVTWHTRGWQQGTYYITGDASTYSVSFNVNPQGGQHYFITDTDLGTGQHEHTWRPAYWDYTVPADGTRSALNLRIYREGTSREARLYGIEVLDLNSTGWSDGDTFTIPGDQVGGETPANDIQFGVNTGETSADARDGICSVSVQNFGAGVNSFLKLPASKKLILRLENDATKAYGITYFVFDVQDNDYHIRLDSFIDPDFRNYYPASNSDEEIGRRGGINDLDYSSLDGIGLQAFGQDFSFATSATPTAYPLKIVAYKAQAPQDDDFAVIQFVQTINGIDTPHFTFSLGKGTQYGQGVWDMDHVYQGFYTKISGLSQAINFETNTGGANFAAEYNTSSNVGYARKRESLFGYVRDAGDAIQRLNTQYRSNRYLDNSDGTDSYKHSSDHVVYYRDSTYDKSNVIPNFQSGNAARGININDFDETRAGVSSSANFDRVIKGISLQTCTSPNLYTLPDDFVLIDFNFTPGATTFLPGDTITISASEVYEVIMYSYVNAATTYDSVTSNSVHGMLFCARTI